MRSDHTKTDLQLIAEGDESAFYEFYSHYADSLRTFLLRTTRSEFDIEDIIQETFIRVWLNRDQLPEIENIPGWIYRIASRVYLDHIEKEIRHTQRKTGFGNALYGNGSINSAERTHLNDITIHLHRALEKLSESKRKILWLNREMQMKPAQIAAHLEMPVGTVKNQLSAALRELRTQMIAMGFNLLPAFYPALVIFYGFFKKN
ncbi:MAG: RNA polymerase sigma factor [Chitinophagaceae bacterium]